jgi:hypothetical protein
MEEALPDLKERTALETLYTDPLGCRGIGGYGSPDADQTLLENRVEQIQTAIRGRAPSTEKLNLSDFEIEQTQKGVPAKITCPQAQTVAVHPSSQKKGYVSPSSGVRSATHFEPTICQACPFYQKTCPAQPGKRDQRLHLNFNQQGANVSQRRRRSEIHKKEGRNLRAAIEATVREIKHPFPASKLPVRGRFRVACMVIGSALATNAHRIQRYLVAKIKAENKQNDAPKGQECSQEQSFVSFFARLKAVLGAWRTSFGLRKLCVSF